jgi:D-proline reductase (dithiol) PrdB
LVYLHEMPPAARDRLVNQDLPPFDATPCIAGPALSKRRVAIVTTAGLHRSDDKPFAAGVGEYRIIPDNIDLNDLIISHASTNFDRSGFFQDLNVVFPIERLRELRDDGAIGSIAARHFAFMGATPPEAMEAAANDLAAILKQDQVDGIVLAGV